MTAPTPERRVGEAWLTMTEAEAGILLGNFVSEKPIRFLLDEITAQRAAVARLTAEVERLTKEKAALRRMIEEDWTEGWWEDAPGWEDKMREAIERELALHLAALALPTPAPEATNDGE